MNKKSHSTIETPAQGQKGFLLYNPFTNSYFFRIYDSQNKGKFIDYELAAEDIEVEILSGGLAFYQNEEGDNRLGWSSKVLGR